MATSSHPYRVSALIYIHETGVRLAGQSLKKRGATQEGKESQGTIWLEKPNIVVCMYMITPYRM